MYIYNNISTSELVWFTLHTAEPERLSPISVCILFKKGPCSVADFAEALKTMLKDLVIPVVVKILHNLIEGRRFIGLCRFCHYLFLI